MRISDWSSDVCSSDLPKTAKIPAQQAPGGDDLLILIISERGGPDRARRRGPARVGIVYVQRLFGTHRFAHRREQGRVRFAPLTVHRAEERRVGTESGNTCNSRGLPQPEYKSQKIQTTHAKHNKPTK